MIDLQLHRMYKLLKKLGDPHLKLNAIHVAGTNGKGSVCSYIESALLPNYQVGKYTSPHLISPNDSIQINGKPMDRNEYNEMYTSVLRLGEDATPFEVGTAVAFKTMADLNLNYSIIEVGLGGRLDATNVLGNVLCSAITKIGIDHVQFLGETYTSVATEKAGIMRENVPCVVDGSNNLEVLDKFREVAHKVGTELIITAGGLSMVEQNKSVAAGVLKELGISETSYTFNNCVWPGRLQFVTPNLLVDGCHNVSAARELRAAIPKNIKLRFVVAFSKPCDDILDVLLTADDEVVAVEFGKVENMPWVRALPQTEIVRSALRHTSRVSAGDINSLPKFDGLTIVCGSLYLVGEFLKHTNITQSLP